MYVPADNVVLATSFHLPAWSYHGTSSFVQSQTGTYVGLEVNEMLSYMLVSHVIAVAKGQLIVEVSYF